MTQATLAQTPLALHRRRVCDWARESVKRSALLLWVKVETRAESICDRKALHARYQSPFCEAQVTLFNQGIDQGLIRNHQVKTKALF